MNRRLLIFLPVLAVLILGLQVRIDAAKQDFIKQEARPFVPPRADLVKVALLGYHTLLADFYWLEEIQYFAEASVHMQVPPDLYAMTNFITDLDPRFDVAYYFAGVNLTILGGDSTQIISILEKGKKNCPDYYPIPFTLGYYYYFESNHPELAAQNLELTYRLSKIRTYGLLAARIRSEIGSPEQAITFLIELLKNDLDDRTRELFERRLAMLQSQLLEQKLTTAVNQYFTLRGQYPNTLSDLATAGLIRGLPPHPLPDHRFVYDPLTRQARSEPPIYYGVFHRQRPRANQPAPGVTDGG